MNEVTSGAPASNQAIQRIEQLKEAINAPFVQMQLKNSLSDNSNAFAASIIELYQNDEQLKQCDPRKVVMECMKAAVIRLPILKSLGYAWIIAYKGVPQFQIGYKGLVQLAIRTNEYRIIHTDDIFEGQLQTINKLTGEFDFNGPVKSDKVTGYFAHFELNNGFSKTLYMTVEKIREHAQKYSKSFNTNYTPWKTEFSSMAKKTVLSNLLKKWGYLSIDMQNAVTDDDPDAAAKVADEIRGNANARPMSMNGSSFDQPNNFAQEESGPGF